MTDESTPGTVVVIDDDDEIRGLLARILGGAGFTVIECDNGLAGVEAVISHQPVLVTLDVNMPGIDGFETTRRIRENSDTYIVLITALSDEADAVLGFGLGADDVVTKPFRARELRARFLAMARRPRSRALAAAQAEAPAPATTLPPAPAGPVITRDRIQYDGLELDRSTRSVVVDGVDIVLTRTEFELLATILESERRVRSKADLVLTLRDESYLDVSVVSDADERTIEAHITNLRRKLGESAAQPRFIETVRGVGYRALTSGRGPGQPA